MAKDEPNAKMPIPGYEEHVRTLRGKLAYLKQLESEVQATKTLFRDAVAAMLPGLPCDVSTFEFLDPDGSGSIVLALPDVEKTSSRTAIKPKLQDEFRNKGLDLAPYVETEDVIELRGDYVAWFQQLLEQWKRQGVALPSDGLSQRSTTRLSVNGIAALRKLLETDNNAADVLSRCMRAGTITAR